MLATRSYIEGLTSGLSAQSGIKFVASDKWATDINKRVLYYDETELKNMPIEVVKGIILHEVGHLKYTVVTKETPLQKKYPALQNLYNALEDIRIEGLLKNDLRDFASEGLDTCNAYAIQGHAEHYLKGKKIDNGYEEYCLALLIALMGVRNSSYYRDFFIRSDYNNITYFLNNCNEVTTQKLQATREEFDGIGSLKDDIIYEPNTDSLIDLIDRRIFPIIKDLLEKYPQPPKKEKETATTKTGKGQCEYKNRPINDYIPLDSELKGMYRPYIDTLAFKLNNILTENKATKYAGAYRSGKLLSKNSYKVITNDIRCFSKKNKIDTPHYAVNMILDSSGSMAAEHRAKNTYIATYVIQEACKKLGFDVNVVRYNDKVIPIDDINDYRDTIGGGNNDYDVLKFVYGQLDKQKDNIIFMMTDGGVCQNPTDILNKIKKDNIPFYAIGVGTKGAAAEMLEQYYPNHINVENVELLPTTLISLMAKTIHR